MAAELAAQYPEATAVGIGAAAWIDAAGSTVLFAPNLAWRDEPLRDYVAKAVGLPTVLENDANVAAWAEFRFGAARDADDSMVMITVGTGIGGGIVLNGGLWRGANGIAGELGPHAVGAGRAPVRLRPARLPGAVRERQRPGPVRPGRRPAGAGAGRARCWSWPAATRWRSAAGWSPRRRSGGDGVARDAFAQIGYWLGVAMADLAQIFDPQVLVVGGGVIDAGGPADGPTERTYREQLAQRGRFPVAEVKAAETGNTAGVLGAADLARRICRGDDVSGVPLRVLSYNVHGLRDDRAALTGLVREARPGRGDRAGGAAPVPLAAQVRGARRRLRHGGRGRRAARRWATCCWSACGCAVHDTWCLRYPLTPGRHLRGAAFARCSVRGGRVHRLRLAPGHRPGRAPRPGGAAGRPRCPPWRVR